MTDADLNKAIEVAEEAVAGFADDDSFEQLLALAVLELRERLNTERVTVADWFMHRGFATGHGDAIVDMIDELEWQIAEKEREACAKMCDYVYDNIVTDEHIKAMAFKIRARGQE
jgi:hypothetical protein